ncbi:MAG: N-6 DNA methylase [Nitrososphaerota archaeon]
MGRDKEREAAFQAELYRHLRNLIGEGFSIDGLRFTGVEVEFPVDNGTADIVVMEHGKPFIVIETKRVRGNRPSYNIDPLSSTVLAQAVGYAVMLGARYIVTANREFVASFTMPERGEKLDIVKHRVRFWLLERLSEEFARDLLETIARFHLATEVERRGIRTPLDWTFIIRLRSFVSWLHGHVESEFRRRMETDASLRRVIEQYCRTRGIKLDPSRLAREACYVFTNKIVFYKVLERHNRRLRPLREIKGDDPDEIASELQELFENAVRVTDDFEAVFLTDVYDRLVLPSDQDALEDVIEGINSFIQDMDRYRLEDLEADVVGHVYESLIEPAERHQLGQFYTPPAIAELIVRWCVRSPDDKVLDPAAGSGTFLVKAYARLKTLKMLESSRRSDRTIHREALRQLYAVDIDAFPAHLTAMNLAMRDVREPVSELNVIVSDFFNVRPGQTALSGYRIRTPSGEKAREVLVPTDFDAVVANPPYTRWVEIPDGTKEAIQMVLSGVLNKYNLTARVQQGIEPGIYIHFIMHAYKFLRPGGRLGMIISDSWLQTDYGVDFGRYLLENWKVKAVIDISVRVFPVPLTGTCIVLLEKPYPGEDVNENEALFMYVDVPENGVFDVDAILKALEDPEGAGASFRIIKLRQGDIPRDRKWINLFFNANEVLSKLQERTVPASALFEVSRGNSIWSVWALKHGKRPDLGAKEFFYFNREKAELWGLEKYLHRAITSARHAVYFTFTEKDWEQLRDSGANCYIFVCHEPRTSLPERVMEYIRWGETKCRTRIRETRGGGVPCSKAKACQARERHSEVFYGWYDLGGVERAPILAVYQSRYKTRFILNEINAVTYHAIIAFIPKGRLDKHRLKALLAYLNSSFSQLYIESKGRTTGAVGPIAIEVRQAKEMPIIDVNTLGEPEIERLAELFDKLDSEARALGGADNEENIKKLWDSVIAEIDREVARILGLPEVIADAARALAKIMMERRLKRTQEARPEAIRGEETYKPLNQPRRRKGSRKSQVSDDRQMRLNGML